MPADDLDEAAAEVVAETLEVADREGLSPAEYEAIKDAVFGEEFNALVFADVSYFVLGNYDGDGRERRLELVCDELRSRDGAYPFLMKHIPEAWELWPTKFEILASRTDHFVPVMEDTWGSHEWELGRIFAPEYRDQVYVLKREYDEELVEQQLFDALPAQCVEILDRGGQVSYWRTESELIAVTHDVPL